MDMVGGAPWKTSTIVDSEEGTTPAVDIGMEVPEVDIPRAPKEDKARSLEDCTSEPKTSRGTTPH